MFIVIDWAMKFLPHKYCESQSDWFGKRGISWHISVVYRRVFGELQSQGFIHIVKSCSQNSSAVVTIMQHVLCPLATEYPNITKAFFRQDNAGCYHAAPTLLVCPSIEVSTRINVTGMDFSDPQGGKGVADRMATVASPIYFASISTRGMMLLMLKVPFSTGSFKPLTAKPLGREKLCFTGNCRH